ncbi:hypothetical protein [Streptomyces sp. NPDC058335]|uniref:hypothetical protein n=1 Tax=Streptomyces sp. NPDC058335 TaxID=3346451 RepID=UPI0036645883
MPVGRQRDWIPVTTLAVPTVWMATASGIVSLDLVAVELAVNGRRKGWTLTPYEAAYAADLLLQRGVDYSVIALRVGASGTTLRKWFPTDDTPLSDALTRIRTRSEAAEAGAATNPRRAKCGTYRGNQRHRKRGEPQCEPCLEARRAAERHYRQHGTYVGAPEVAA